MNRVEAVLRKIASDLNALHIGWALVGGFAGCWTSTPIPRVAAHGWVAITKTHKIRSNPVEARIAVESKARIVGFAGRSGNMTSWQMMTTLARHWTAIENQIVSDPSGPWWLSLSSQKAGLLDYRM